ncbi:MAG: hypothetical protein V1792_29485 [Pseudomonadota bacterium]
MTEPQSPGHTRPEGRILVYRDGSLNLRIQEFKVHTRRRSSGGIHVCHQSGDPRRDQIAGLVAAGVGN